MTGRGDTQQRLHRSAGGGSSHVMVVFGCASQRVFVVCWSCSNTEARALRLVCNSCTNSRDETMTSKVPACMMPLYFDSWNPLHLNARSHGKIGITTSTQDKYNLHDAQSGMHVHF